MGLPIMTSADERDLDIIVTGAGCAGAGIVDSVEAAWERLAGRYGISGALALVRGMATLVTDDADA